MNKTQRIFFILLLLGIARVSHAITLNENCVINILNRTIYVLNIGGWSLSNVPSNQGAVRARATCADISGDIVSGRSDYFNVIANGITRVGDIVFEDLDPIPTEIRFSSNATAVLESIASTVQFTVSAFYADNSSQDVTLSSSGINYFFTNTTSAYEFHLRKFSIETG